MAPPVYKPLTSAGGLQGAPNLSPHIFGHVEVPTLSEVEQKQAALLAAELSNQNNQLTVDANQRKAAQEARIREALIAQYGQEGGGTFDPQQALDTVARLSLEGGDVGGFLAAEKARDDRSQTNQPLSPEMREYYSGLFGKPIPEGSTMRDVKTSSDIVRGNAYQNQVGGYLAGVPTNIAWKQGQIDGTNKRGTTDAQEEKLISYASMASMTDNILERYEPHISENRGERFVSLAVNPNSAAARMQGELVILKREIAKAYNTGALSNADVEDFEPLTTIGNLDTMATVKDKLLRVRELMQIRKGIALSVMQGANRNVSAFTNPNPGNGQMQDGAPMEPVNSAVKTSPTMTAGKTAGRTAEEEAYKEQYKAKLRAQRGL